MKIKPWRMFGGAILLVAVVVTSLFLFGGDSWRLAGNSNPGDLGGGATYVQRDIEGPVRCTMRLAFFNEAHFKFSVMSQGAKPFRFLPDIAADSKAVAGVNGSYYDPQKMVPAGLEIAGGVYAGKYGSSGPSGGVVGVRAGKLFLEDEHTFSLTDDVTELLQCGPMLIQPGRLVPASDEGQHVARTFVMTDGAGRWAIGTCDRATLPGLAGMLANKKITTEFKVQTAMALDGGPSTGMWWRSASGEVNSVREKWAVRNFLLVVPR